MGTGGKLLAVTCDGLASHPGEVAILLSRLHATETGLSSGSVSELLARVRPYLYVWQRLAGLNSNRLKERRTNVMSRIQNYLHNFQHACFQGCMESDLTCTTLRPTVRKDKILLGFAYLYPPSCHEHKLQRVIFTHDFTVTHHFNL